MALYRTNVKAPKHVLFTQQDWQLCQSVLKNFGVAQVQDAAEIVSEDDYPIHEARMGIRAV